LLQGAVFTMAPRRWRAVVAEVPFVDCVTTMLDPGIPLTASEWDETRSKMFPKIDRYQKEAYWALMKIAGMPVPFTTPAQTRRHLPRKRVPTPQLPECGLRDNLATHPPIFCQRRNRAKFFQHWQMLARRNGRERTGPR
jgi:hypothetical protein